jgi:Domain of Unknown Function (DUF1080).
MKVVLAVSSFALVLAACSTAGIPSTQAVGPSLTNALTAEQQAQGWRLLFDGHTLDGWRGYKQQTPPAEWRVENGTLTKSVETGDLLSRQQFQNFELAFDWMLGPGGNSGVFFHGTEEYDHIYWSAPEYQLLDDSLAPDGKNRLTAAGSNYALDAAPAGVVKRAGEWNSSLIVVQGAHVQHWMNGQKLLEYDLWSPEWEAKVKASKFGAWPNYGRAKSGYIAIQGDHPGVLSLKNIRIRVLP